MDLNFYNSDKLSWNKVENTSSCSSKDMKLYIANCECSKLFPHKTKLGTAIFSGGDALKNSVKTNMKNGRSLKYIR